MDPIPSSCILFYFPLIAPDFSQPWSQDIERWYGYSKPTKGKTSRYPARQRQCQDGSIDYKVVAKEISEHQAKLLDAEAARRVVNQHEGRVVFFDIFGGFQDVRRDGNKILEARYVLKAGETWDMYSLWGRRRREREEEGGGETDE